MDVSSVSSGSNAALAASLQAPLRTRSTEQDAAAQQLAKTQASEQAQGTTPADERQARAVVEAEKIRPTVNINGQTVGARINTTA